MGQLGKQGALHSMQADVYSLGLGKMDVRSRARGPELRPLCSRQSPPVRLGAIRGWGSYSGK